ncbi:MAG TPA: amidohydrolase family protein [Candidatus Saccharimonadales bacterium]|jgi:5-methylthioadenosine/S-adenosylhomocysteine deaminase|nr:amidohydrolase family protein [Candidatus Saccharimonadales bacterium]
MRITGGTVLSMRPGDAPSVRDLWIDGQRIAASAGGETIDASGCYVMPGLVQTHIHLVQTIFRGLAEELSLLEWLRDRIWPLEAAHDEASLRATARLGLLDLLTTGTTTILDMGTTHGGDVIAEELVGSGIRARFGQTMMDAGDGVPTGLRETTDGSLKASARLAKTWDAAGDGRIGYAYAPRFALSCTRELLEAVADVTERLGLTIHTHSNENTAERALIERATGQAPMAYLESVGLVNARSVIAHGVNLDEREVAILADRGAAITHCPSSNLKLGSGIADVRALRDRGITVGVGADGAACNNRLDGFDELRLAALLAASLHGAGALSAWDILVMGTRDGARALRMDDRIGTLEVGKSADLIVLDPSRLAGPAGDPATRIVYGGGSRAVRDVIVDGKVVVRNFSSLTFDGAEVRARAAEALPALAERAGI